MPNDFSLLAASNIELMSEHAESERDNWRLLRKLDLPETINRRHTDNIRHGITVDVETTGLSTQEDEVVQIAILPFTYDPEFNIVLEVDHANKLEALREPGIPMSEEASLVTGITDEMLIGHSIDPEVISRLVGQSDLIIAHNSSFDRPMVEKLWPIFQTKPWGCSLTSIDWLREGYSAGKLDYLGMQFGWFYDGHRALADCEACLALLAQDLPKSARSVLSLVREAAARKQYLIPAYGAPFDMKDLLKQRGYRWRPDNLANGKVWWTICDDVDAEKNWLQNEIYRSNRHLNAIDISALNRFSERIWEF